MSDARWGDPRELDARDPTPKGRAWGSCSGSAGLTWISMRVLAVRQALQRIGAELRFVEPKRAKQEVRSASDIRHRRPEATSRRPNKASADSPVPEWTDTGLVFTSTIGTALDERNVRRISRRHSAGRSAGHATPRSAAHDGDVTARTGRSSARGDARALASKPDARHLLADPAEPTGGSSKADGFCDWLSTKRRGSA